MNQVKFINLVVASYSYYHCSLLITPQVTDKCKFDLVRLLEDHEDLHTILSDALMEIGTIAIDNIFSKVNFHSCTVFS